MTVEQLEGELTTRYKEFIQEPQISVTVTEFRSQPVSVFGAVTKPGVIQLRGPKSLYEVLSMAGGPRETAGSTITISRRRENGDIPLPGATVDATGQFSVIELNVEKVLEGKIPGSEYRNQAKRRSFRFPNRAPTWFTWWEMFNAPGRLLWEGSEILPCSELCHKQADLGARPSRKTRELFAKYQVIRSSTEIPVNIKQMLSGKADDIKLLPNDVLVVPTSSRKVFTTEFLPSMFTAAVNAAIYHY